MARRKPQPCSALMRPADAVPSLTAQERASLEAARETLRALRKKVQAAPERAPDRWGLRHRDDVLTKTEFGLTDIIAAW